MKSQYVLGSRCSRLAFAVWVLWACVLGPEPASAAAGHIDLNLDRVDIRLLVQLVSEVTGKAFVLDDTVEDRLTVVTPERVAVDEVYPLFLAILESSGWTVLRHGDTHRIVPVAERAVRAAPLLEELPDKVGEGLVLHIFRLEHVPAAEMARVLQPLVAGGAQGALAAIESSNHLLVTDTAEAIRRLQRILKVVDRPGPVREIEVLALETAPAEQVARQLREALAGLESPADRMTRQVRRIAEGVERGIGDLLIIAAEYSNSLVLAGHREQIEKVKELALRLDRAPRAESAPLQAIFLNYLSAEVAARDLNALLEKRAGGDHALQMAIEASVPNNALLVHGAAHEVEWLRDLVIRLDRVPQQVLVEVLIAEVAADRDLDFGFEWSTIEEVSRGRSTLIGRSRPGETDTLAEWVAQERLPRGLTVGVARGVMMDAAGETVPRVPLLLQALARDRDVRILSNVPLWAQNHTEASVSVVENRPVLRSVIEAGAGTARDIIQNIDRMDVGIKLTVTPQVHPDGHVQLQLNPSIEAIVDEGPADAPFTPTIAKREVVTTVTVPDRSTVMLSGLIRDDQVLVVSKVPLLGDIPLLGYLFQRRSDQVRRTNLLIFVTPTIVTDMEAAARLRSEWEERSNLDAGAMRPSAARE